MHRIVVSREDILRDTIILNKEETHHLLAVKRITSNEIIELIDGEGTIAKAFLIDERNGLAVLKVVSDSLKFYRKPVPEIILVQAIPKHPRMENVLEKSVELGIQEILPVITERTIVRLAEYDAQKRGERWRKKVQEAVKQSGALWFPKIWQPLHFKDVFSTIKLGNSVVFAGAIREKLPTFYEEVAKIREKSSLPEKIYLFIGPEGDFTDEELDAISRVGGIFVQFGTAVLRTDTAAIFGLSVLVSAFPRQFL